MPGKIHLILGGARSGKSNHAESVAQKSGGDEVVYVATAEVRDREMEGRVKNHISSRNPNWETVEASQNLGDVVTALRSDQVVLIDCLTLWLSRQLEAGTWEAEKQSLMSALEECDKYVLMVSNEVGLGVVPMGKETRLFVDEAGRLHQDLAKIATDVTFVMAGLPQTLKGQAGPWSSLNDVSTSLCQL